MRLREIQLWVNNVNVAAVGNASALPAVFRNYENPGSQVITYGLQTVIMLLMDGLLDLQENIVQIMQIIILSWVQLIIMELVMLVIVFE